METITLAEYLEKNPKSKRLQKRFARALKTYIHMTKDLSHASEDLAHAKEDCSFAIQNAEQVIEDCRSMLQGWHVPAAVGECELSCGVEEEEDFDACFSDEHCMDDEEEEEEDVIEEASKHLRDASKDIVHALQEAGDIIRNLRKIDALLFDIVEIAEGDDLVIEAGEAKQYIVQKANEVLEKPVCSEGGDEAFAE